MRKYVLNSSNTKVLLVDVVTNGNEIWRTTTGKRTRVYVGAFDTFEEARDHGMWLQRRHYDHHKHHMHEAAARYRGLKGQVAP